MSVGQNIKRLRESCNLTQSELAKIAGATNKAVSTWENDKATPRMGAIQKIADYFGVAKSTVIEDFNHENYISDNDIKFALFKCSKEVTDEMYREVLHYAAFIEQKYLEEKK